MIGFAPTTFILDTFRRKFLNEKGIMKITG
jgi:hypothetical protein